MASVYFRKYSHYVGTVQKKHRELESREKEAQILREGREGVRENNAHSRITHCVALVGKVNATHQ